jgi:hypothetical protein
MTRMMQCREPGWDHGRQIADCRLLIRSAMAFCGPHQTQRNGLELGGWQLRGPTLHEIRHRTSLGADTEAINGGRQRSRLHPSKCQVAPSSAMQGPTPTVFRTVLLPPPSARRSCPSTVPRSTSVVTRWRRHTSVQPHATPPCPAPFNKQSTQVPAASHVGPCHPHSSKHRVVVALPSCAPASLK